MRQPQNTVIWISLDGIRPDYLERGQPAFLRELAQRGVLIDRLQAPFPTLTFPSHTAMATGVEADQHGIVANTFYDRKTQRVHRYPWYGSLLEAEPIWTTTSRAGIPTAVYDWVLSHDQRGNFKADFFGHRYVSGLSPQERLAPLVSAYADSIANQRPLRLIMGYLPEPDTAGHRYGPDSDEVLAALRESDQTVADVVREIADLWRTVAVEGDRLIVLISSDHGMAAVEKLVHPERLVDLEDRDDLLLLTAGNLLQIYFRDPTSDDLVKSLASDVAEAIANRPFAQSYTRDQLPPHWNYNHPSRTADILVVLDPPYTFSRRIEGTVVPVGESLQPRGMHGYDTLTTADMETIAIIAVIDGNPELKLHTPSPMPSTYLRTVVLELLD